MNLTPKLKILAVLIFLAVVSLIYGILAPARQRGGKAPNPDVRESGAPSQSQAALSTLVRKARGIGYTTWGRSPFMPKTEAVVTPTKLILAGIAWDDENPKAVINDEIVGAGDKVGGNTVVSIQKDRVIMSDGSSEFELR